MIIGNFEKRDDKYYGNIVTLALCAGLRVEPTSKKGDKSPDYRVYADNTEIGAAWCKTSQAKKTYLSISLDDPSFASPITCRLVAAEGENFHLVWKR